MSDNESSSSSSEEEQPKPTLVDKKRKNPAVESQATPSKKTKTSETAATPAKTPTKKPKTPTKEKTEKTEKSKEIKETKETKESTEKKKNTQKHQVKPRPKKKTKKSTEKSAEKSQKSIKKTVEKKKETDGDESDKEDEDEEMKPVEKPEKTEIAPKASQKSQKSDEKAKKPKKDVVIDTSADQSIYALNAICKPLANPKLTKECLKLTQKAANQKQIRRGVKEVVKALRKHEKGLCLLAGDISPVEVMCHIPIICEEAGLPYVYVPSKSELGVAAATKRPTSCVLITGTSADILSEMKQIQTQIPVI